MEEKMEINESEKRPDSKLVKMAAAGISVYLIITTLFFPVTAMIQRAFVLTLSFFIIFLQSATRQKENKVLRLITWAWAALAVLVGGYVVFGFESLINRMGAPNTIDLVLGGLCIIMVLDATRRSIGWPLPIVTCLFLLYTYFGNYLTGTFSHRGYGIERIINQMYMTTEGIFGVALGVVVTIVFLFILFGAVLEKSGGGKAFIDFSIALAGRARGGPAKIAVFGSGMMGMISGSSIANVATVGTLTIPLMVRVGYRPEFAGAVEAAAAVGGQIMPPVMGAGAFIMAEFTQTPYLTIISAAAIPAILYYFSLYMNVHYEALRTGMKGMPEEEIPPIRSVLKQGWIYIVPLLSLMVTLVMGFSPARAAFVGIGLLIIAAMMRASTRMKLSDFWGALCEAGQGSVSVAAACACAGIIVGTVSMTGLGIKFSNMIGNLAGDYIILALMLTALSSLILGMALPTTANYIVQAAVAAPALVALGIPKLTAHLFVFYFGVFADITPPVALAAYTAAGIAKADPMKTAMVASRNVMVAYLIPFLFVYFPALLGQAPISEVIFTSLAAMLGVVAMSAAWSAYFRRPCTSLEQMGLVVSAALMIFPEYLSSVAGLTVFFGLYWVQGKNLPKKIEQEGM
jgi:TRAP transporter 4TM/12TM fusion protein